MLQLLNVTSYSFMSKIKLSGICRKPYYTAAASLHCFLRDMNYDLPPPIDLRRLPWFIQQSMVNTGFCVIESPVIAHFLDHILEQVDAMPARTYLLNNNGGGLSQKTKWY